MSSTNPAINQPMMHLEIARSHRAAGLVFALGLAACSGESNAPPSAVSEGEMQALEEAASMLDEQRPPVDAIAPPASEPEAETTENAADLTGDAAPKPQQ